MEKSTTTNQTLIRPTRFEILKQMWKNRNIRYGFLWLSFGIVFSLFGKRAIRAREKELVVEEVDEFLKKKN